jgi:hypothetical protein
VGDDETLKRWMARNRVALVLKVLHSETIVAESTRRHGLTVAEIRLSSGRSGSSAALRTPCAVDRWTMRLAKTRRSSVCSVRLANWS